MSARARPWIGLALAGTSLLVLTSGEDRRADDAAVAAHYREHHDAVSLAAVTSRLRLGTPRAEVEHLLGPPTYCPVETEQCYYASDARNSAGVVIALVLEYRVWYSDGRDARRTDRIESLYLGPVAE